MAAQTVFRRYELKYMLTEAERDALLAYMTDYMVPDRYGETTIRNVYYDTPDYRLIRRSIEKPAYKEKLRVRSYKQVTATDQVFVELKKKYDHVVYKRRCALSLAASKVWLSGGIGPDSQIGREIDYTRRYYRDLRPAVFLSYRRQAFYGREDDSFRITFDDTILARTDAMSLTEEVYGTPLLPDGMVLMEVKCGGGMPLWLVRFLSEHRLYKTSFSKYGTAYERLIYPNLQTKEAKESTYV